MLIKGSINNRDDDAWKTLIKTKLVFALII